MANFLKDSFHIDMETSLCLVSLPSTDSETRNRKVCFFISPPTYKSAQFKFILIFSTF